MVPIAAQVGTGELYKQVFLEKPAQRRVDSRETGALRAGWNAGVRIFLNGNRQPPPPAPILSLALWKEIQMGEIAVSSLRWEEGHSS